MYIYIYIHSCPKLSLQPVLLFSSFVHNSSINELKNMKLRGSICYEIIIIRLQIISKATMM